MDNNQPVKSREERIEQIAQRITEIYPDGGGGFNDTELNVRFVNCGGGKVYVVPPDHGPLVAN